MLLYEEALERALAYNIPQKHSTLHPTKSLGLFLQAAAHAPFPIPQWNNSAMDGYAIRWNDLTTHTQLEIIEEISAGHCPQKEVFTGTCSRIFTGAPIPVGADTVVIQENVERFENRIQITTPPKLGANIRKKGEEFSIGEMIAPKGTQINVGIIGLACAMGIQEFSVYHPPKIAILSTGDELIDRTEQEHLQLGQIWSSNNHTLGVAIQQAGGIPIDCGIVRDTLPDTMNGFQRALSFQPDLIISTGGVSVGDHDRVQEAIIDIGGHIDFWKVRVKPGKPLLMGHLQNTPFFGLPGNPVSALVSFWLFVYPLIQRARGNPHPLLPKRQIILTEDIPKKHSRAEFIRVRLTDDGKFAKSTGNQSSAWLSSIAHANALLYIPAESTGFAKGDSATVYLLPSS